MKLLLAVLMALLTAGATQAATNINQTWNVRTVIPDKDDVGYSNTRTISAPGLNMIRSVTVDLAFTGDSRTAMLSSFTGLNSNGNWTLFVVG